MSVNHMEKVVALGWKLQHRLENKINNIDSYQKNHFYILFCCLGTSMFFALVRIGRITSLVDSFLFGVQCLSPYVVGFLLLRDLKKGIVVFEGGRIG